MHLLEVSLESRPNVLSSYLISSTWLNDSNFFIFFIFLSADFERSRRGFSRWQQIQLGRHTAPGSYFNGGRT